ncbi:MAG: M15 family metallopeptidase [Lachnospiraceae bacterium]|nr:M15 family metallopeptidase [Lachnospiraceae bacterium]
MINRSRKECVCDEISRRSKKNKVFRFFSPLIKGCFLGALRISEFCMTHLMKFVFVCTSALCFIAFCSFSFPLFTGSVTNLGIIDFNELDESITLASDDVSTMTADEARVLFGSDFRGEDGSLYSGSVSVNSEGQQVVAVRTEDILIDAGLLDPADDSDVTGAGDAASDSEPLPDDYSMDYSEYDLDSLVFDRDDWRLILVNKQHSVPDDYEFPLGNLTATVQCDERVIEDLVMMLRDARNAGMNIWIVSPYRSGEIQENLFNYDLSKYMNSGMNYFDAYQLAAEAVTLPGTSEHQIGLAFDIVNNEYAHLGEGFGETAEGIWLAENCYKYGFILRYPADKEYITTIEYEPWHFRYVGREAAAYMTLKGLTLEEFWEIVF